MKKQVFLFSFSLLFAGCSALTTADVASQNSSSQNLNTNVNSDNSAVSQNTNVRNIPSPSNEQTNKEQLYQQFYVAEKKENITVVYLENRETNERRELLRFEEYFPYDPDYGNTYMSMPPSVAYSPVRGQFAYTSKDGLFLYDLTENQIIELITKTGSAGEFDGIEVPLWSHKDLAENVYHFQYPLFSSDGSYLSFSQGFYEGLTTAVFDLRSLAINDLGIGRYLADWSQKENNLVLASYGGYTSWGLFFWSNGDFTNARNLLSGEFPLFDVAVFVNDSTIAYSYAENLDNASHRIALIDTDGSGQKTIVDDKANNFIRLGGGDHFFYLKDSHENAQDGLWMFDLKTNSASQLLHGQEYDSYLPQDYSPQQLADILVVTSKEKGPDGRPFERVQMFDLASLQFVYTSQHTIPAPDSTQRFLGWMDDETVYDLL